MNNQRCLYSAYSLFIPKKKKNNAGAVMWSAIWKYPVSVPGAPDKDVLMFSPDRPHVFLLIREPDRGS